MLNAILTRIIGTKNERELKAIRPMLQQVSAFEPAIRALDDHALAAKTVEFRERLAKGATLDDLLPEAFAVVREAGWRVLQMRHFDVQLIGGMALHRGMIAEMKTGEGKTLVATLAAYLNALSGKGVHVVTVNDYLAKRDSEWMGRLYKFLGLTVGVIQHHMDDRERQLAYGADITYGTNNEFGFDYLRDNMKFDLGMYVQRGHNFAIVDEVDSILIDEARTPLIISGPAEESTDKYYRIDTIIPKLKPGARITGDKKAEERAELEKTGDYIVDEKAKTVTLTEMGMAHSERLLGMKNLWDPSNMDVLHHVNQGLRAHTLFQRDVDYVVKDGQVAIVDEFTGRLMPGRRWSDGLHQAVEAKEKVKIERENQTLATITFQNYFRMYSKLGGHDRHGRDRGRRVRQDLQARGALHPDQPAPDPRREPGRRLPDRAREVRGRAQGDRGAPPVRPAGARGHDLDREVGAPVDPAQEGRHQARGAERQVPRARGRDGGPGGPLRRRHDRDEHGRPRHRHHPGRRAGPPRQGGPRRQGARPRHARPRPSGTRPRSRCTGRGRPSSSASCSSASSRPRSGARSPSATWGSWHRSPGTTRRCTTVRAMAPEGTPLASYLDACRALARPTKEKIAKSFYPQIEEPVDFLTVHPLRTTLDSLATSPEFAAVEGLLEADERERVVALGGVHILGTERHEARRIDNQLRGRAGRQGDPGSSRFYLSLEDDLMRIFGSERISGLMLRLGMEEGVPIEHGMVTKSIERAQKQVEAQNFAIRKHLLEYDDVMNKQRKSVYDMRRMILEGKNTREHVLNLVDEIVEWYADSYCNEKDSPNNWALESAAGLDEGDLRRRGPALRAEHHRARDDGRASSPDAPRRATKNASGRWAASRPCSTSG